jgi:hypothetical protein
MVTREEMVAEEMRIREVIARNREEGERLYREHQARRTAVVTALAAGSIGVSAWLMGQLLGKRSFAEVVFTPPFTTTAGAALALSILMAGGTGLLLLLFLNGSLKVPKVVLDVLNPFYGSVAGTILRSPDLGIEPAAKRDVERLSAEIEEVRRLAVETATGINREDLVASLLPALEASLVDSLLEKNLAASAEKGRRERIRETFSQSEKRLWSEIKSLRLRSQLNLIIGVLTTGVAIWILNALVVSTDRAFDNLTQVAAHYVPRITLVVFVEVFSFFFLRLYRATLDEIRAYQADVTRLNVLEIATEVAISDESAEGRRGFASVLVNARHQHAGPAADRDTVDVDKISSLIERLGKLIPATKKAD